MKIIKFCKNYKNYNSGDIAGFNPDIADNIIKGGYAVLYLKPKTQEIPKPQEYKENKMIKQSTFINKKSR